MSVIFRKAGRDDLDAMVAIAAEARAFLKQQGLDQWQNGYPQPEVLAADIAGGNAYVLADDGPLLGMAALIFAREADYEKIYDGAWGSHGDYAAIHRVALSTQQRGSGLASQMLGRLEALCRKAGAPAIRIDTHPGNLPMQKLLAKNGFTHRGTIYLSGASGGEVGAARVAYDKLLGPEAPHLAYDG